MRAPQQQDANGGAQQQLRIGTDNLPVLNQVAQPGQPGTAAQGTQASHGGEGVQEQAFDRLIRSALRRTGTRIT